MRRRLNGWTTGIVGLGMAAGLTVPAAAIAAEPVLVFHIEDMASLASHPTDQGLARAIGMLPDRIRELPGEIPDFEPAAAELIASVLGTVSRPWTLAIMHDEDNPGPTMGYGAVLSVSMDDREHANELHQQLAFISAVSGGPEPQAVEGAPNMLRVSEGPMGLTFGVRESGDDWRYELHLGTGMVEIPDVADGAVMGMSLDLRRLNALAEFGGNMAEQEGEPAVGLVLHELTSLGLLGEDAMSFDMTVTRVGEKLIATATADRVGKLRDELRLPTEPMDRSVTSAIPAGAWTAMAGRYDLEILNAIMDKAAGYGVPIEDSLEQVRAMTGIDVRADLIAAMGGHAVFYTADETGGGGMLSAVALLELKDAQKMEATLDRLTGLANGASAMIPEFGRYIGMGSWTSGDDEFTSLRFPGVPVPLELTFGVAEGWLVMAATPQGATTALAQLRGEMGPGLASVESFKKSMPKGPVSSFSYADHERSVRVGYPMVQLMGSAVANMVRSPAGAEREPGLVTPAFSNVAGASSPMMSTSRWDGDSVVWTSTSPSSIMALLAMSFGRSGGGVGLQMLMPMIAPMMEAMDEFSSVSPQPGIIEWLLEGPDQALTLDAIGR